MYFYPAEWSVKVTVSTQIEMLSFTGISSVGFLAGLLVWVWTAALSSHRSVGRKREGVLVMFSRDLISTAPFLSLMDRSLSLFNGEWYRVG